MKKIVTLIDFSVMTEKLVRQTIELATQLNAKIELLYLTPPSSGLLVYNRMFNQSEKEYSKRVKKEKIMLAQIMLEIEKTGRPVSSTTINGTHIKCLLQKLEELRPDYVVVGSKTRSWLDEKITGSHWTSLIAECQAPLIIVPACKQKAHGFTRGTLAAIRVAR